MSAAPLPLSVNRSKRNRWCAAMGIVACLVAPQLHAQSNSDWKPSKAPEFIVPSGAGAALDVAARKLTDLLAREGLSPHFVVSNKSGAHSIAALESLHRHPGDAHTLMTLSTSYGNSMAQGALPAHLQKATPLATLFREYLAVVVPADSPIRNVQDLLTQLRADPGKYSIGIATTLGNHIHLGIAQPLKQGGVAVDQLRIVPYKSSAESMTALVGGHLDIVSASTPNLLPYLQSGRVRVLAIAAEHRLAGAFTQAPTWKEQGVDYVNHSFQGVMTAPGVNAAQQAYWVNALRRVSDTREWKDFVALNQWSPQFLGPQDTAQALREQTQRDQALLAELGLLSPVPQRVAKASSIF